jgi:aryl-alcohol dehydrogenase-like predicted oxidoreductase
MHTRQIGDRQVSAIGLGAMPMSLEGRPPEKRSIATIHAALDAGVTLIDTANSYCISTSETGHNERLVAKALRSWSGDIDSVLVATKGGHYRPGDGSWQVDGRPESVKKACEGSLRDLGRDVIDLYQYHRPDPEVPWAESVGALKELKDEGKIKMAGVSNADEEQIAEAQAIAGIVSVQNELSPDYRASEGELELAAAKGLAFLAWSPFGGISRAPQLAEKHPMLAEVAKEHGVSPHQVVLAWMLAKSPNLVPIPGASRPETILDSLKAASLKLDPDELARLDGAG